MDVTPTQATTRDVAVTAARARRRRATWPRLPLEPWQDTYATLHMWTQIVGKVRLALSPQVNHWWAVSLYVTPRGLTTSSIPHGADTFEVVFDFRRRALRIHTSTGKNRTMALRPRTVADFYGEFMDDLRSLGIEVSINPLPQEVANPIPFDKDYQHAAYDADAVARWWRIMLASDRVSSSSAPAFWASPAWSTSSGAASTWR